MKAVTEAKLFAAMSRPVDSKIGTTVDQRLYTLEGQRGLWRRKRRTNSTKATVPGAQVAIFGDGLAEFVRDPAVEVQLLVAGFEPPKPEEDDDGGEREDSD